MSPPIERSPQLLSALLPAGHYEAPIDTQGPTLTVLVGEELSRLLFRLEGGFLLDIPMTQDAIAELARLGQALMPAARRNRP